MCAKPDNKHDFQPVFNVDDQLVRVTMDIEYHPFVRQYGCITVMRFEFMETAPIHPLSLLVPCEQMF